MKFVVDPGLLEQGFKMPPAVSEPSNDAWPTSYCPAKSKKLLSTSFCVIASMLSVENAPEWWSFQSESQKTLWMVGCSRTRGVTGPNGGGSRNGIGTKSRSSGGSERSVFTAVWTARLPRLSSSRFGGAPADAGPADTSIRSAAIASAAVATRNRAGEPKGR